MDALKRICVVNCGLPAENCACYRDMMNAITEHERIVAEKDAEIRGELSAENARLPCAPGMSLRDWFAGQALAGCAVDEAHPNLVAQWCYRIADAMLAAREAQGEEAGE